MAVSTKSLSDLLKAHYPSELLAKELTTGSSLMERISKVLDMLKWPIEDPNDLRVAVKQVHRAQFLNLLNSQLHLKTTPEAREKFLKQFEWGLE